MRQAAGIGQLLKEVLDQQGVGERLSRYQAWLVWDKIVGEQIARRARPLRLRDGVLEVRVDHPVWMQQLQMLKPKILQKLNARLPKAGIEDIYLRQGSHTAAKKIAAPPAAENRWREQPLGSEELEEIEKSLQGLEDGELRDELRRIFTLQKRLSKGQQAADD